MSQDFENAAACWKAILSDVSKNRELLSDVEKFARENNDSIKVVFGTSGWRGEIGTDYTFNNIRIVTSAIIRMFKGNDPSVMQAMGVSDFEEIKKRGAIIGHDVAEASSKRRNQGMVCR
jgi:phosphomannomutase